MTSGDAAINEDRLQEYIDGRLTEQEEAAVAAHLLANPAQAAYVQKLREQNKALQAVGSNILNEPVPERLQSVLDTARQRESVQHTAYTRRNGFLGGVVYAGALAACLAVGWFGHAHFHPSISNADLALLAGSDAHRFYSQQPDYPVQFNAENEKDLGSWLQKAFGQQIQRPDLADIGYSYIGGRLLPFSDGRMGLQIYENEQGERVSILIWSADDPPRHASRIARLRDVQTRLHWNEGLAYAVLCDKSNKDFDRVANAAIDRFSVPKN